MKLTKAIEILQHENYLDPNLETPDIISALMLGVEALKLKQKLNSWSWHWHEQLLPGETEE